MKPRKIDYGNGQEWFLWNQKLNSALEQSIEAGRKYIEITFRQQFGIPKPPEKTYREAGLKIAYHLQERDLKATGGFLNASPKLKDRFKRAAVYGYIEYLSSVDPWGLDSARVNRPGNPGNLKPKTISERGALIESIVESLSTSEDMIVTCGKGTKQQTVFRRGTRPNTIQVSANRLPFTYDVTKPWDRKTVRMRLWRWSKKEELKPTHQRP